MAQGIKKTLRFEQVSVYFFCIQQLRLLNVKSDCAIHFAKLQTRFANTAGDGKFTHTCKCNGNLQIS